MRRKPSLLGSMAFVSVLVPLFLLADLPVGEGITVPPTLTEDSGL